MTFPADLSLLPLDGDVIAFSESAQCLLRLNASAALVVSRLRNGVSVSDLAGVLASEGHVAPQEAEQWVSATLGAFTASGLLGGGRPSGPALPTGAEDARDVPAEARGVPPYTPFEPAMERRYRLLETCALVRFGSMAQVRLVDSVIGHLGTDDKCAPTVVIDIRAEMLADGHLRSDVYRDGLPVGGASKLSRLGPIVKAALWQSAINAHDFQFYIHAGVVAADGGCIILPATAGSGKSSLTAALVHHGVRYFSDEVALIEPTTFHVPPMPLATCVKSTGWEVMAPYCPEILSLPVHVRGDAKVVRYIPPQAGRVGQSALPISHIIFPQYDANADTVLVEVERATALGRLMGECLAMRRRLDITNVQALIHWIGGVSCHDLTFSSLDAATRLVVEATGCEASEWRTGC